MAGIPPLEQDGIKILPTFADGLLRLEMSGSVEARDPGALLDPFWARVDAHAVELGIKRVELDLRGLEFMNSSGILTLVRWITRAKTHAPGVAYEIALRHEPAVTWQRSNVPVLAKLAPGVVRSLTS